MSRKEHPVWADELMPYLDGQLDEKQASEIAEHLNHCETCKAVVSDASSLSKHMAAWEVEVPSEGIAARVLGELNARGRSSAWWVNNRAWVYGLTGAVAAVMLVAVLIKSGGSYEDPFADKSVSANKSGSYDDRQTDLDHFENEQDQRLQQGQQGQQGQQAQAGRQDGQWAGQAERKLKAAAPPPPQSAPGPMVIRTALVTIVTKDFDTVRPRIEAIVSQSRGYIGNLNVLGQTGSGRTLSATLRLPADQLDSALAEIRKIGVVQQETQNSSDVTSEYVDLQARISNSRNTEQRLVNLLRERTGKLSDVVDAERELSRVRQEIEQMEAQQKNLYNKVQYATVQVQVSEEYHAKIDSTVPSPGTRIRNAAIEGYRIAAESVLGFALFSLRVAPALLLWAALVVPIALGVRRFYRVRIG